MSNVVELKKGQLTSFVTRVGTQSTYLFFEPYVDDNGVGAPASAIYHIEACGKKDVEVSIPEDSATQRIPFQDGGAVITVRNAGDWPFLCWTDN